MKVLLDECASVPLRKVLSDHQFSTIDELGWKGIKNGALVAKDVGEFDALITADKNFRHQQNLSARGIAILELPTPHWPTLRLHVAEIQHALDALKPDEYVPLTFNP
jgi:hypothetical protein